eukprot:2963995-Pleurochrysis_carterae.AAC.3
MTRVPVPLARASSDAARRCVLRSDAERACPSCATFARCTPSSWRTSCRAPAVLMAGQAARAARSAKGRRGAWEGDARGCRSMLPRDSI